MKIRSRRTFNTVQKKAQQRMAVVLVSMVVLLILMMVVPIAFRTISRIVLVPVHAIHAWFEHSSARFPLYLRKQSALIERITTLEHELATVSGTDLTEQRLYEENRGLRALLGVKEQERIAAGVIARPGTLPYDVLQIDRGTDDGIVIGAPVYVGADRAIGVVVESAPRYAFVELFTTPGFTASAFVSGANVFVTLEGYGGGVARVRMPQGIPLTIGNLVYLPGLDSGLFGEVSYVENEPSQPEQYGYVTLPTAISGIQYVSVAKDIITPTAPRVVEDRIRERIREAMVLDTKALSLGTSTIVITASSSATTTSLTP
jgi:cell shape-determining protein MreC